MSSPSLQNMLQDDSCQCITGPQEVFPDDRCLFCSLNASIEEDEQYVYSEDEEFDYCRACGADFDICTCYDADSELDFWWPHQLDFNCTDSHFSGWDSTPGNDDPNVGSNNDRDYDDDYYYDSDSLSFEQENMEYWDRHCEFVADVGEQGYGIDFETDTY